MSDLYQTSADLRSAVQDLARQEQPAAALTLTRSAVLAITTAGTLVTWQVETRNQGFTWSGSTITIPTSGYYAVQCFFAIANTYALSMQRFVNGVNLGNFNFQGSGINYHSGTMVRYFVTGDALQIRVVPGVNVNISVNAEGVASESPFIHITQLTGVL
jgi:hypothetical protein